MHWFEPNVWPVHCFLPFYLLIIMLPLIYSTSGLWRVHHCHWYFSTDLPLHISPSSGGASACLLQEHSAPSASISSLCALLLLNDVMSCFSQFVIRHTRWEMDIPFPNGIILLPFSRIPDKPSLLVALFGKQESKEYGQHWKRFCSRISVTIIYKIQEMIGLEYMLFYIFTRKSWMINFT